MWCHVLPVQLPTPPLRARIHVVSADPSARLLLHLPHRGLQSGSSSLRGASPSPRSMASAAQPSLHRTSSFGAAPAEASASAGPPAVRVELALSAPAAPALARRSPSVSPRAAPQRTPRGGRRGVGAPAPIAEAAPYRPLPVSFYMLCGHPPQPGCQHPSRCRRTKCGHRRVPGPAQPVAEGREAAARDTPRALPTLGVRQLAAPPARSESQPMPPVATHWLQSPRAFHSPASPGCSLPVRLGPPLAMSNSDPLDWPQHDAAVSGARCGGGGQGGRAAASVAVRGCMCPAVPLSCARTAAVRSAGLCNSILRCADVTATCTTAISGGAEPASVSALC